MENAQSFSVFWKPLDAAIGQLLAPIAPAATGVPFKTTTMKEYTNFAGHSDGHGNALI
jgi:hypothetical protein